MLCLLTGLFFSAAPVKGQVNNPFGEDTSKTKIIRNIFSSTRIVNGHSVEQKLGKQLEFRISHRFGPVNSKAYNFFGLDQGLIHFSLEYGIKDWLTLGIGRGTFLKTYDAFAKFLILNQTTGEKNFPFHLTFLTSAEMITLKQDQLQFLFQEDTQAPWITSRMAYTQQLLIAREFNDHFSFQLTPTYIYRNMGYGNPLDKNIAALGFGARYRITKKMFINVEYYLVHRQHPDQVLEFLGTKYYNPLSVGLDIVAGGHVFQITLTNSQYMRENSFIATTTEPWKDGGIHLGFNISRTFDFYKDY